MTSESLIQLLAEIFRDYEFEPVAIYKKTGCTKWPFAASSDAELEAKLRLGGHFLPLPKEPAALANIVEVALVDHVLASIGERGLTGTRGTERGYPDIEVETDGRHFAVDVKVARRKLLKSGRPNGQTDSRITLYTGNTFFMYPEVKWSGTFRPFGEYAGHVDIIAFYTLDESLEARVRDFELAFVEPWRVASRKRSSTTREYLGAVMEIDRIVNQKGDFSTESEFYAFWRKHDWKIGKSVRNQLQKLLSSTKAQK